MYPEAITRIHAIPIPSLQPKPSITRDITVHLTVATAHPHRRRFEISAVSRRTSAVPRSTTVKASSAEEDFVKKTAASHDIVIFSKTYCPYCRRAKAVFDQLNMVPYVVELDQREDGDDIQDALDKIVGRRTVPQVFINGNHLGGSDDTVEAYASGRLVELLGIDANVDL